MRSDGEGWGRPGEGPADADRQGRVEELGGGEVEVLRGRVGGFLHGELEIAWSVGSGARGGGRRGDGEAAGFGEGGDEGVEPLAGEELGVVLVWV